MEINSDDDDSAVDEDQHSGRQTPRQTRLDSRRRTPFLAGQWWKTTNEWDREMTRVERKAQRETADRTGSDVSAAVRTETGTMDWGEDGQRGRRGERMEGCVTVEWRGGRVE